MRYGHLPFVSVTGFAADYSGVSSHIRRSTSLNSKKRQRNNFYLFFSMTANIIWKSAYYHSEEHCVCTQSAEGNTISSTIAGHVKQMKFEVTYTIDTNCEWETIRTKITSSVNARISRWQLERKESGWLLNDRPLQTPAGTKDIDISLTPFTNTLPVRRLVLKPGDTRVIDVVFFDVLQETVMPVKQIYTCQSKGIYLFGTYERDFEALLRVNGEGLVEDYPGLFQMVGVTA